MARTALNIAFAPASVATAFNAGLSASLGFAGNGYESTNPFTVPAGKYAVFAYTAYGPGIPILRINGTIAAAGTSKPHTAKSGDVISTVIPGGSNNNNGGASIAGFLYDNN